MIKPKITLIIPVYNEASHISDSYAAISAKLPYDLADFDFIFIDDGSSDSTWIELLKISSVNRGIRTLRFSRNFGKEAALCAGLEHFSGDACITMDSDLQHPPELIAEMVRLWNDEGYEIVEGLKTTRGKESILKKAGALLFYFIMFKLSGVRLSNASDFKLMDSKVVNAWKKMKEHDTFMRGMSAWLGFRKTSVDFSVSQRSQGNSKWSFLRLFKLAVNAITSFSSLPMHIVTIIGVLFFIGSLILGIHTLYMKLTGSALDGFTTIILLQLIIGSTLMLSLGIIGSYIARIFNEVKMRPRYIISEDSMSSKPDDKNRKDYGIQ